MNFFAGSTPVSRVKEFDRNFFLSYLMYINVITKRKYHKKILSIITLHFIYVKFTAAKPFIA